MSRILHWTLPLLVDFVLISVVFVTKKIDRMNKIDEKWNVMNNSRMKRHK